MEPALTGAGFLAVLVVQVLLWRRIRAAGADRAIEEALDRQRQAQESAARDLLERIGRFDAEGREALARRMGDFSREMGQMQAEARRELSEGFSRLTQMNAEQLSGIRQEVERKLADTVAKNQAHFGEVAERLSKLYDVAGQMTGQMNAVSPDIRKLAAVLASPKGRGAFGEFSLSQILRDLLPQEFYREQYAIQGQERVDAAILLKDGILAIDSKFSLPAGVDPAALEEGEEGEIHRETMRRFHQAVLARAQEIAAKYIVPGKTLDFALLYIPAESIYYRVILQRDLHQKLLQMKVIPVSPNSFYAYLQAIAVGLRGMKLEANALQMQRLILQLRNDFERFGKDFGTLGNHLENARKKFGEAERDVARFTERVSQLSLGEPEPDAGNGTVRIE